MATDESKVVRAHCNSCGQATRHEVVAQRTGEIHDTVTWSDGRTEGVVWHMTSEMLECCGCGTVTLRRTDYCPDLSHEETEYYPPRVSRRFPHWFAGLPDMALRPLLREVYAALHADSRRLAMMGARALIDLVMLDKVGDTGTFGVKLDALVSNGYVSVLNREFLEAALEAGHAATHRGYEPTVDEINRVMDIIENLLQAVYVLKDAADKLKKATPKRS